MMEISHWIYKAFLSEKEMDTADGPPAPAWIAKTKTDSAPLKTQWVKGCVEHPP